MKKKVIAFLRDMIFYILGSAIYSFAIANVLSAAQISPGGITGIATSLNFLFGLPVGIMTFLLNVPLFALGLYRFGMGFVAKTVLATAISSVFLDLWGAVLPAVTVNRILAAVFGGILMGLGMGLILLRGATTGGTDIAAKLINRSFPHISVGRCVLISDFCVVVFSSIVYANLESALLSVITIYASSRIMDSILYGADSGKMIFTVSKKSEEIAKSIISEIGRGVTLLPAFGGYTGEAVNLLVCAVRKHEVSRVHSIISSTDNRAFIMVCEAGEILGEGFKLPNTKTKG